MINFTEHSIESASPEGKKILEGVQAGYGFIPNLFKTMIEAPVAVEAYLTLNKLIDKSSLSAAQAQVALLAVSIVNECGFCSVAHRAMAKKAGVKPQTIEALVAGREIEDSGDRALARLAVAMVEHRGWVPEEIKQGFLDAGFTKQQVFEVILTVTIKTLSNYSNHLTSPEPNPELLAML